MNLNFKFINILLFTLLFFPMQSNIFGQSDSIPILMYHKVWNESKSIWWVTDDAFQKQMDYLAAYGFHPISMADYFNYVNNSIPLPQKPVMITFDDAFQNFYTHAYPVLVAHNFKAAQALITDFVGSSEATRMINSWDPDSLERTFQVPHLIWPEIRTMHNSGLIEFDSHSKHHPSLTTVPHDSVLAELNRSKITIEDSVSQLCNTFVYPNGVYNSEIIQEVEDAGYIAATTVNEGYLRTSSTAFFEMPRFRIDPSVSITRFAEIVDPRYQHPQIQIMNFDFKDTTGSDITHFNIGDSVITRIRVRNSGPMITSKVILQLDTIPNPLNPFYDSHQVNPSQDQTVTFGNGSIVDVYFRWKIPAGTPYGQWYYNIQFWGEHYIIQYNFNNPGWHKGFSTAPIAKIKVFLQGPYSTSTGTMSLILNSSGYIPLNQPYNTAPWNYNGNEVVTSIPSGVVDWVLLELRSNTTTPISRRAAFLKFDGSVVDLDGVSNVDFPSVSPGSYYVVIRHRNHLAVMTANPVTISSNPPLYDLSTAQSQAYGSNPMKALTGGGFGMIAGDASKDGSINATDLNTYWIPQNGTPYDYQTKTADFSLDATINATDLNVFWIPENGKATQVP